MKKMNYSEAKELLESRGIDVVKSANTHSLRETVSKAEEIGYPLVAKIDSPDVVHKSDEGFVETNIENEEQLKNTYEEMKKRAKERAAHFKGLILQEHLEGKEIIIGGKTDSQFGPVVLFGMGGVFVELFEDTSLRIVPINKEEAKEMMKETKAYELLSGYRGEEPVDTEKITEVIVKVGRLMTENPEIKEMDLNPLLVDSDSAKTVDLRIIKENGDD